MVTLHVLFVVYSKMNIKSDYYLWLCIQRISGTISAEDSLVLDSAIKAFPKIGAVYAELRAKLVAAGCLRELHTDEIHTHWLDLKKKYEERMNRKKNNNSER